MSLSEQMGHIGSEVSRASLAKASKDERFWGAVDRGLELFHLTITDARWRGRERELARTKECFCDAVLGGTTYGCTFESLMPYFDEFALKVRS